MNSLTIYLLREEFATAAEALEGLPTEVPIENVDNQMGTLYVKQSVEKAPAWADLFSPYVDINLLGTTKSTSALYITSAGGRLFALAFGNGRHLLKPGACEERFGLLVVINSVNANQLRSIDKRTFDVVDQNVRSQVSQQSSAAEFGIDIEKDLIRAITGRPADEILGSRMTGADALSVAVDTSLASLNALLLNYLAAYQSQSYLEDFSWIDHIAQIGDKSPLKATLDDLLVAKLQVARENGGHVAGCWLAIPDIIEYANVHRFRFSGPATNGSFNDLHLPGFMQSLRPDEILSVELLKLKYAHAVDEEHQPTGDKWTTYNCIHCEVQHGGADYLLASGRWFRVKHEFSTEINEFYAAIPTHDLGWMAYQHPSEGHYNEAVCDTDGESYALMDKKNISVGGIHDKVEFCDVYTATKEIIHVKRYGGSSLLGHLFNQGLVSGEHLREDKGFLAKVNAELPAKYEIDLPEEIPRNVSDFKIIFAIISEDPAAELHIPFFAKVALKHVYKRLSSMGFPNIMLAKIPVDEVFSHTEKVKEKAKKATKKAAKKEIAKKAVA